MSFAELYSSHSSISFPSSSNSTSEEMETTNEIDVDDPIKKEKKDKSSKFKGASSYKCQFCEKSFPRLGYLKKHEQVSESEEALYLVEIKLLCAHDIMHTHT
jgi:hypothetical protein